MGDHSLKKFLESQEYQHKRKKINDEINSERVDIDYSVFKKTDEEKAQLANAKIQYKNEKRSRI